MVQYFSFIDYHDTSWKLKHTSLFYDFVLLAHRFWSTGRHSKQYFTPTFALFSELKYYSTIKLSSGALLKITTTGKSEEGKPLGKAAMDLRCDFLHHRKATKSIGAAPLNSKTWISLILLHSGHSYIYRSNLGQTDLPCNLISKEWHSYVVGLKHITLFNSLSFARTGQEEIAAL